MRRHLGVLLTVLAFVAIGCLGIWLDLQRTDQLVGNAVFASWLATVLAVGAVICWQQPRHNVGRLLMAAALAAAVALTAKSYAAVALIEGRTLPAPELAAWISHWLAIPAAGLVLFAMILFPEGRLPSTRWRPAMPVLGAAFVLASAGPMFKPGPIDGLGGVRNPYATSWGDALWDISQMAQPIAVAAFFALIVSFALRTRRGTASERQQIKWVAYAVAMVPAIMLLSQLVQSFDKSNEQWLGFLINMAALLTVPIAIGVAILRYRLYDVDLVVNRTIVYVLLTAFLGGAYVGGVTLMQALVPIDKDSDLAIAASTLIMAALFQPARRRIQGFIDHYFYRRKYNAERTVDEFSSRLRDEIDLSSLNGELVDVVARTMQPTHVSVWLATPESRP
jgi:hypothetical protein